VTLHELAFPSMGTEVRLLAADAAALPAARAQVERLAAILTRFDPASELCRLNADPRRRVRASADLRAAVAAALEGARVTGGLADPTLLDAVEAMGPRAWAQADPALRWRSIRVGTRTITRPPGVRLDLGGSAKGWIADRVAAMLGAPCAVDCGGDIRVRGAHGVEVRHPRTGALAATLELRDEAVATSGIDRRGHHLIDPATRRPAHTRAITATAIAPTAAEAEARAKAALLDGPRHLAHGGVMIAKDGAVMTAGRGVMMAGDGAVMTAGRGVMIAGDGAVMTAGRGVMIAGDGAVMTAGRGATTAGAAA
jgi:thiamine biosynthesis lipoprotein